MRYQVIDIELTASVPMLVLDGAAGLGVVVRHRGVIQAFTMRPLRPRETPARLLDQLLVQSAEALLAAAVRRELAPASQLPPERTLTVVICTKDRPDLLKRCLDAVVAIRPSWVEIMVVDNASE